jgi:hypothetical protein
MPLDGSEQSVSSMVMRGKEPTLIIEQVAGWVWELAWTLWKDKPLAPAGN